MSIHPIDWSDSYREPLCEYDNKGRKFFSPVCTSNYQPPQHDIQSKVRTNVDHHLQKLQHPSPKVKQFSDKESAHDWFKDPTYAQRISARKQGVDDNVLDTNPSLQLYHKLKYLEKTAESMMQSL